MINEGKRSVAQSNQPDIFRFKYYHTGKQVFFKIKSTYKDPDTGFAVAVMIEDGRRAYTVLAPPPTAERPRPHLTPIIKGKQMYLIYYLLVDYRN